MLINYISYRNDSKSVYTGTIPLANIGRMSGDPHDQVNRLSLNTESNSTGFSFQPSISEHIIYRKCKRWASMTQKCVRGCRKGENGKCGTKCDKNAGVYILQCGKCGTKMGGVENARVENLRPKFGMENVKLKNAKTVN